MATKLVFVGEMGAGKTTAIRAISDMEPISTEMPISDEAALEALDGKSHTTVALDYSSIELGDGELLHVYGVPGQAYLDFMWPIVAEGAIGVIVLVSALNPRALPSTLTLLEQFRALAPEACFAVGVTCQDRQPDFHFGQFRDALAQGGYRLPVMWVDARESVQVDFLVKALLSCRYAEAVA
ncbi:ATP/GTP-binding protein [Stenotrophomonas sp. SY1]|jgi:signal recognition particle receptor subunit beta|nr:ATP/GTP-binding protein [Stenotrophomonas sp. SY1]MCD9085962.1 ATP/GTP-binding protein [Stenotrophomonas sp. SY1]